MHPAARERVEADRVSHPGIRCQVLAPGRFVRRIGVMAARRAHLVQEQHDGLADPAEDLHLGLDVARGRGSLGGVDEIEDHVALVLDVADRLLAAVEGAIGQAVPYLREEPPDRVVAHAKTLAEARAVAESRRVPQAQCLAAGGVDQDVTLGGLGDVRLVAHLADVPPQEGPCERRLADVGMGHEAQIHDGRRARGHGAHAGAGCHSAARRRSTAPPSAAAVCSAARSRTHARRPRAATNASQAARRATSRSAKPACPPIRSE